MTLEKQDDLGQNIDSATSSGGKLPFDLQIKVDSQYRDQAKKMAEIFISSFNEITNEFDFEKALAAVKKHTSMAVIGTVNQDEQKSQETVSVAVDTVKKILENALEGAGVSKSEELVANVANAFNDLAEQKDNAWFHILDSTSEQTSYQYNIFYALQNELTGSVMIGLPVSLKVTIDVDERTLYGKEITHKKKSYKIKVQGITIVEPLAQ